MTLGRVVGTVVATRKEGRLDGFKLQVVETVTLDLEPTGSFVVAVDAGTSSETTAPIYIGLGYLY